MSPKLETLARIVVLGGVALLVVDVAWFEGNPAWLQSFNRPPPPAKVIVNFKTPSPTASVPDKVVLSARPALEVQTYTEGDGIGKPKKCVQGNRISYTDQVCAPEATASELSVVAFEITSGAGKTRQSQ